MREATTLPLIAAGGIGTGEGILAAMVLGAEGVQIGTRFALTEESSASPVFKDYCLSLAKKGIFEGDLEEGELEIGQVSAIISHRQSVAEVMNELVESYRQAAGKDYLFSM